MNRIEFTKMLAEQAVVRMSDIIGDPEDNGLLSKQVDDIMADIDADELIHNAVKLIDLKFIQENY